MLLLVLISNNSAELFLLSVNLSVLMEESRSSGRDRAKVVHARFCSAMSYDTSVHTPLAIANPIASPKSREGKPSMMKKHVFLKLPKIKDGKGREERAKCE